MESEADRIRRIHQSVKIDLLKRGQGISNISCVLFFGKASLTCTLITLGRFQMLLLQAGLREPCCYTLNDGIHAVSDELLVNHVGSAIKVAMGEEVARVLALPLLWASLMPPRGLTKIPVLLKQHIMVSRVERVPLILLTMELNRMSLRYKTTLATAVEMSMPQSILNYLKVNTITSRFGCCTTYSCSTGRSKSATAAIGTTQCVKLSKRPKSLYELWGEYEFVCVCVRAWGGGHTTEVRGARHINIKSTAFSSMRVTFNVADVTSSARARDVELLRQQRAGHRIAHTEQPVCALRYTRAL
ncbi:hypothetical protein P3T76_013365 [Phytophthora citrophthora]|uniref:Uncharacterized protein n=1 Tax=Phytophthora citrophthora TaxID=4793 RepID=A0AAD9LC92_9STRA|nr:hypothetical protein P3T76_013365 [Phytophthora citrophthora]